VHAGTLDVQVLAALAAALTVPVVALTVLAVVSMVLAVALTMDRVTGLAGEVAPPNRAMVKFATSATGSAKALCIPQIQHHRSPLVVRPAMMARVSGGTRPHGAKVDHKMAHGPLDAISRTAQRPNASHLQPSKTINGGRGCDLTPQPPNRPLPLFPPAGSLACLRLRLHPLTLH
jgi:hypothetical protein